jgi:hypothetical protein
VVKKTIDTILRYKELFFSAVAIIMTVYGLMNYWLEIRLHSVNNEILDTKREVQLLKSNDIANNTRSIEEVSEKVESNQKILGDINERTIKLSCFLLKEDCLR